MNMLFSLLPGPPAGRRLGPLEQRVLSTLWRRGSASVQELIDFGDMPQAYTTVLTTLDRLCKKQLVNRVMEGKGGKKVRYRYTPRYSQAELERKVAVETIRRVLGFGTTPSIPPLSYLVDAVSEHDAKLLTELRRLVDEKSRKIKR
jgi:predicted transcriptional regulator